MYYSITIKSILKETDINKTECTEGFASYNVQNEGILIPRNKLFNTVKNENIQIYPNCTYKISVYANPRAKPTGKLESEVKL